MSSSWEKNKKMKSIRVINNFKTLYVDRYRYLSFRKGQLYVHSSISSKPTLFANLPMTKRQRFFSRFRLTERLFRLEPRVAIPINENEYLISFSGSVYRANLTTDEIINEHNYRQGMNNTMKFCTIKEIEGFDDCIVYGEYWGNIDRQEVSIYSRSDNKWSKVFSFPKGEIQHIHGITTDPYRDAILILTGDKNQESGIWIARNNFKDVEPLLKGSQRYRACVAFPIKEGIIYATDTPLEDNVIAIAKEGIDSWNEEVLFRMPGPCIYGKEVKGKLLFATSVEPDSKIQGIKYWFTYRLGKGVQERYSHVIMGNHTEGFKSVLRLKKDIFPMLLFQFGNVQFPSGDMNGNIIMCPVGVSKYDSKTIMLD